MFTRTALFLALTAVLAVPAAAQAGTPFTIGEGSRPHLLTNPASGTAVVAWADDPANTIRVCRVPRGAAACATTASLTLPGGIEPDAPYLLRAGGSTLHLITRNVGNEDVFRFTSADEGVTWGAVQKIYDRSTGSFFAEPLLNPAGTQILQPSSNPSVFMSTPSISGGEAAGTSEAVLANGGDGSLVYDPYVALASGTLIATASNLSTTSFWSTTTDPESSASWGTPTSLGDGVDPRLAGDGTNAYLMTTAGAAGAKRVEVRRWAGSGFAAPVTVASEQGYISDLSIGSSGAVATIWRRNEPSGGNRLQFGRSTDGGATWGVSTIAREDVTMSDMDIALAGDNEGWAVYEGTSTPTSGAKRFIRLASTEAIPEPVVTPPPSSTTTTTTPPTTTPSVLPPLPPTASPTALLRRTVAVKGATLTLAVPRACIPPGRPFVATLSWKKQRRKGNLFVKVRRVDFIVGSARAKIDRKAPFRQTLRIPSPRAGQTYRLRARAYIKMRRGRSPKKSIVTTLRVCG